MKQDMSPIAMQMIEALNRGDFQKFQQLRDGAFLSKDEPKPLKSCDFHLAPERNVKR